MKRFIIMSMILAAPLSLWGQVEGKSQLQRDLELEIMAPCCYGGPVGEHESEAAGQIKTQITQLLDEGRGKEEILDMYVAIYGERILARPRAEGFNIMAYLMPPIFLLIGGMFLIHMINQLKSPVAPAVVGGKKKYNEEFYLEVEKEMRELGI